MKQIKVSIIGDSSIGKSHWLYNNLLNNNKKNDEKNDEILPTHCVDFLTCSTEINISDKKEKLCLKIWDISGKKSFRNITKLYIKGSNLVLFFYNKNNKESLENILEWKKWFDEIFFENFIKKNNIDEKNLNQEKEKLISFQFPSYFFLFIGLNNSNFLENSINNNDIKNILTPFLQQSGCLGILDYEYNFQKNIKQSLKNYNNKMEEEKDIYFKNDQYYFFKLLENYFNKYPDQINNLMDIDDNIDNKRKCLYCPCW